MRQSTESAAAFVARRERELGGGYTSWVETDAGQRALRDAYEEDRQLRVPRPGPRSAPVSLGAGAVEPRADRTAASA